MKPAITLLRGTLIASALLAQGLLAAEWQREAGISSSAYLSDNICLSNDNPEASSAATVTPDVYLQGQGARANLYLEAALGYRGAAGSDFNCLSGHRELLTPSLRYLGDLELVDDWLTLQSDAFVGTNPFNPFGPWGTDNFTGRDNINITYQYGAGALVQHRLFNSADMRLRYYRSQQHNERHVLGDSSENRGEFDLGTERFSKRFSMGVAGRYSQVSYAGNSSNPAFDNTLASAEARAALLLGSNWHINGAVGEERNEFTSVLPEVEGSYWNAGLRWTPNDRVEVALGTGERFFGTTPNLHIRYRHRRSELTASYAYSLTFPRNLRASGDLFYDLWSPGFGLADQRPDNFGRLFGDPLPTSGQTTFVGNTPIVNERLAIRYRLSGRRSTLTLDASSSKQLRTEDLAEATFTDLRATFTQSLSAALSANLRLGWADREGQDGSVGIFGERSQTWRVGLDFSRRIGNDTSVSLGYQYTRQESDVAFNQYNENRVTLSARHQF